MQPTTLPDKFVQPLTDPASDRTAAPPTSKGFAAAFLASFALVYFLFVALNWLGNETALFPSPLHPAMYERSWKTRRIDQQAKDGSPPSVFVFGSSRVMQIQPPYLAALAGGKAFNYGVSAGGLIDSLTQLRYLASQGIPPKVVILGIDEFAFSDTSSHYVLQLAAHPGLLTHLPFPESVSVIGGVLGNITPESTWNSFISAFKPLGARHESLRLASSILLGDGYLIYKENVEQRAAGQYDLKQIVERSAHRFRSRIRPDPGETDPTIIQPRKWELFEQFLELARARGGDVRVVLLPVHPDFQRIALNSKHLRMRAEISRRMAAACARRGCQYRDFSSLESYGGDPNEFWDGMHQTPENSRRMMNVLFGHPPETIIIRVPSDTDLLHHLPPGNTLDAW